MGRLIAVVLALSVCGCTFSTVAFKYSSLSHMDYHQAMVSIGASPEKLMYDLSEAFRRQGAVVLERKRINFHLIETGCAKECWAANAQIAQEEFATYRSNSFTAFKAIDRKGPFRERGVVPDCKIFDEVSDTATESWKMLVEFPPRSANTTVYRPTMSNFFIFGQSTSIQGLSMSQTAQNVGILISTRLHIWAWRSKDGPTNVYLEGRPISGQIEAAPGNSIGWSWWQLANGFEEQNVVKSYVLLLEDYDRARHQK